MPGYKTHLTGGTVAGIGLGTVAHFLFGVSATQSIFGGVLCALGGVLPDVDSPKSRAFERCFATISGTFALLLASRLSDLKFEAETVVMIGAFAYFFIFYGVGKIVNKCAVHRGMCHSLVFAFIAGEVIFILSSGGTQLRLFKSTAIALGVLVHLTLDEIYSVETSGKGARKIYLKNSFGTALKLIDYKHMKSTIAFYLVAAALGDCAMNAQSALARFEKEDAQKIRGMEAVDRVRSVYPTQFELSAIRWIAENDFVLSPGSDDNPKWLQLQEMLAIGATENDESSQSPGKPNDAASAKNRDSSSQTAETQEPVSLLDVVNWNSQNADEKQAAP